MSDLYSLNELLLMRNGREIFLDNHESISSYKSEKDADRKTFFRYLKNWELKEIFDDYYFEKGKKLSKSWLVLIEYIFSINSTGARPAIGIVITDKKGKQITRKDIEESGDIKNIIRKGTEKLDNDKETLDTYNSLFLILNQMFEEDFEIGEKYIERLKNSKISLTLEKYMTYEPVLKEICKIPDAIINSKCIPENLKYKTAEDFYSDCGKLLDKWEEILK